MPTYSQVRAGTFALAIAAALCCPAQSPPKLVASSEFRCLWWSPEQQRNFNPNQPPPKATEVLIDRWEYTDPVGTPNPDVITAVVSVRNDGGTKSAPLRMNVEVRWKSGPQSKPESARWERRVLLKSFPIGSIAPAARTEQKVPIAIRAKITALERRDWWPHEMELIVTGRSQTTGTVLFEEIRPFPIRPGD